MSAAAVLPINSERFDFHGYEISASRDLHCRFCPPKYETKDRDQPPTISFLTERDREALSIHAQLTICATHVRKLADRAEELAPKPWSPEQEDLLRRRP